MNHLKEAINLLVMDKSIITDEETVKAVFSHLNILQIRHIVDQFKPDDLAPDTIPPKVKKSIEELCTKKDTSRLHVEVDPMYIRKINLLSDIRVDHLS